MDEIDRCAKVIWDYMLMHQSLKKADCILVMGSYDRRVGEYGVELFIKGYAPLIIFSGGETRKESMERFGKTEAEAFAEIARSRGVPESSMLIENRASNTAENIAFTQELIKEKEPTVRSYIVVQKPFEERRTYATVKKILPNADVTVTSPSIQFLEYPNAEISKELVINNMVGVLKRIPLYAERGWLIPQEISPQVWQAYEYLVNQGYNKQLPN